MSPNTMANILRCPPCYAVCGHRRLGSAAQLKGAAVITVREGRYQASGPAWLVMATGMLLPCCAWAFPATLEYQNVSAHRPQPIAAQSTVRGGGGLRHSWHWTAIHTRDASHLVLVRGIFRLLHLGIRLHVRTQRHGVSLFADPPLLGADPVATMLPLDNVLPTSQWQQVRGKRTQTDGNGYTLHRKRHLHHRLGKGKEFVKSDVRVILELQEPLHLKD